jgi:hypothetical protein
LYVLLAAGDFGRVAGVARFADAKCTCIARFVRAHDANAVLVLVGIHVGKLVGAIAERPQTHVRHVARRAVASAALEVRAGRRLIDAALRGDFRGEGRGEYQRRQQKERFPILHVSNPSFMRDDPASGRACDRIAALILSTKEIGLRSRLSRTRPRRTSCRQRS